jgi:hypothetical protein
VEAALALTPAVGVGERLLDEEVQLTTPMSASATELARALPLTCSLKSRA